MRQRLADRAHNREQVLIDGVLPVALVQVLEGAGGRAAGVVDHDVQPAQLHSGRRDGALDVIM